MDSIIDNMTMKFNKNIEVNFDGGDLSSDSGLLLMNEFIHAIGLDAIISQCLFTAGDAARRVHSDVENLLQVLFQIFCAYFNDDHADSLANEPVLTECVGVGRLASQPTLSRFFSRMTSETEKQFWEIMRRLRNVIYSIEGKPKTILLDLDSTLLNAYGKQEGRKFNNHYQQAGYHPLMCFDGLNGDLLRAWLREGSDYCCKGAAALVEPLINELSEDLPGTSFFARADSGFASPELYDLFEKHGIGYVIRLKENSVLRKLVKGIEMELFAKTGYDLVNRAEVYGEFMYQAKTWPAARRVVVRVEKPANTFMHKYTFIVTNLPVSAEFLIGMYCKRGQMENYIKECKDGFDADSVSSAKIEVNANRFQVHLLAYNAFNAFRRLVLPATMKKDRIDTVRFKLFKVASRVIRHSRKLQYRLCSSCVHKREWMETMYNIQNLSRAA